MKILTVLLTNAPAALYGAARALSDAVGHSMNALKARLREGTCFFGPLDTPVPADYFVNQCVS